MDTFTSVVNLINHHFIRGIFISVLLIIFVRKFLKKVDTQTATIIIKWLLITYSIGVGFNFLLFLVFSEDSGNYSIFWERARGPYKIAYWIMFAASILPLLLFLKGLSDNIYFILILSIFMNIGWLFESFVIHTASMHLDYYDQVNSYKTYLPFDRELLIVFEGMILGIATMSVGNLIHSSKEK